MVTTKYDKHILREPMSTLSRDGKVVFNGFVGLPQQLNTNLQLLYSIVTKAHVNEAAPHVHTFPIVMSFIGANPNNIKEFDAEIEFYLGGEKQIITTTAMVSVPAGLAHCPLIFKRVGKPIVFLECMLTDNYERTEVSLEELQNKLKEEK
jgi:hypothetical protein